MTENRNFIYSQFKMCRLGQYNSKYTFVRGLEFSEVNENSDFQKHLQSEIFKTNKMKVITENRNFINSQFKICRLGQHNSKNTYVRALKFSEVIVNSDFQKRLKSNIIQANKRKVMKENRNLIYSQFKMCPLGQYNSKNTFVRGLKFSEVIVNSDFKKHLKSNNIQANEMKVMTKNRNFIYFQFKRC